jgi:hypothetical protein
MVSDEGNFFITLTPGGPGQGAAYQNKADRLPALTANIFTEANNRTNIHNRQAVRSINQSI